MYVKANRARDRVTFSLGGMAAISSYAFAPAIAADEINKAWDERLKQQQVDQSDTANEVPAIKGRFWLLKRLRTA